MSWLPMPGTWLLGSRPRGFSRFDRTQVSHATLRSVCGVVEMVVDVALAPIRSQGSSTQQQGRLACQLRCSINTVCTHLCHCCHNIVRQ
jgi:hypothetical protein